MVTGGLWPGPMGATKNIKLSKHSATSALVNCDIGNNYAVLEPGTPGNSRELLRAKFSAVIPGNF